MFSIPLPLVCLLGPYARPLAPYINRSYNSSSALRSQGPILLEFPSGWKSGHVHEWYKSQPETRFTSLEYRKELTGTFRHEFIVVRLDNGTCCRFDRRARHDMRVYSVQDEGTIAEDTAQVLQPLQPEFLEIEVESELLLSIGLSNGADLLLILAICFFISIHPRSKQYSLARFNCYFFCWTITMITVRQMAGWETILANNHNTFWLEVVDPCLSVFLERPTIEEGRKMIIKLEDDLKNAGDVLRNTLFAAWIKPVITKFWQGAMDRRIIPMSDIPNPTSSTSDRNAFLSYDVRCRIIGTGGTIIHTSYTIGDTSHLIPRFPHLSACSDVEAWICMCSKLVADGLSDRIVSVTSDFDYIRFKARGSELNGPITPRQDMNPTTGTGDPGHLSLEDIINRRIEDHSRMVQNFGFSSFGETHNCIQEVMTEIWVNTPGTLKPKFIAVNPTPVIKKCIGSSLFGTDIHWLNDAFLDREQLCEFES